MNKSAAGKNSESLVKLRQLRSNLAMELDSARNMLSSVSPEQFPEFYGCRQQSNIIHSIEFVHYTSVDAIRLSYFSVKKACAGQVLQ